MLVALSPYHLTTREPAAMAALLLAERVVTMMPTPFAGAHRTEVERAVARAPRYLDLMESWRWSMPLWTAGVVGAGSEGADASGEVRAVCERVRDDERFAPLRRLMREGLFEDERAYLDAVACDLLRAGPDPAISVPVAAGLDRFAAMHGMFVVRSAATSVAQRAEERMARRLFAFAVPVMKQASAGRILEAREALAEPLAALSDAVSAAVFAGGPAGEVTRAARDYARAFEPVQGDLSRPCEDEDDLHAIVGTVSIVAVLLPVDAVLESSLAAVRTLAPRASVPVPGSTLLPAVRDPLAGATVVSLIVRLIGRR